MDLDLENVIRQALEDARAAGRNHLSQAEVTWLLVEPRRQAVELRTSIEEPEDMNTSDRGLKHVCPE